MSLRVAAGAGIALALLCMPAPTTTAQAWRRFDVADSTHAAGAGIAPGLDVSLGDRLTLAIEHIRRGQLDQATSLLEQNLETASEADYPQGEWEAMLGLGDVAVKRGAFPEALTWDRRAAMLVDTLRGGGAGETGPLPAQRRLVFEALIHLLATCDPMEPDSGWAAEAFGWSERAKAHASLDLLGATEGRATAVPPLSLTGARGRLGPKDALLAYSVGDSGTSLWVITPGAWKVVALPPRDVLLAPVEVLRRSLADSSSAENPRARAAARALDSLLIDPARRWLRGVKHLVIAPDDALARIPFEVLLARPVSGNRVPAGSYLVERFTIRYVPSAAALAAGARSVVVSLWKVNDRSTAELMRRFYAALLIRGAPREVALASAKRALLADPATRSPYHWAPFVLVGEGGRVP